MKKSEVSAIERLTLDASAATAVQVHNDSEVSIFTEKFRLQITELLNEANHKTMVVEDLMEAMV